MWGGEKPSIPGRGRQSTTVLEKLDGLAKNPVKKGERSLLEKEERKHGVPDGRGWGHSWGNYKKRGIKGSL